MDGESDKQMDRQTDGQMDRWTSWELVRKANRQDRLCKIREKQKAI